MKILDIGANDGFWYHTAKQQYPDIRGLQQDILFKK